MELEKFKTIVLPLRSKMLVIAHKMLSDECDAEDAVQETLIRMWQAKDRLSDHPNMGGYAMLTLKNICLDKIKLRRNNIQIDDIQIDSESHSPYTEVENKDSLSLVEQIIRSLPELQQLTIRMRDIEEYELHEIAAITGSTVDAVKVNLSRARKRVRDTFIRVQTLKLKSV